MAGQRPKEINPTELNRRKSDVPTRPGSPSEKHEQTIKMAEETQRLRVERGERSDNERMEEIKQSLNLREQQEQQRQNLQHQGYFGNYIMSSLDEVLRGSFDNNQGVNSRQELRNEEQNLPEVNERQARLDKINSLSLNTIVETLNKIDSYTSARQHSFEHYKQEERRYAANISMHLASFRDYKKYQNFYTQQQDQTGLTRLEKDVDKVFNYIEDSWGKFSEEMKEWFRNINISDKD